jgi:kynurenine formamidase
MDAAGAVDAQHAPTAPWKTAPSAVSHSAHTHPRFGEEEEQNEAINPPYTRNFGHHPVHQLLLTRNGIYLHENLITAELARDNAYEFMYSFAPLRLKGATGSPGNPVAIR